MVSQAFHTKQIYIYPIKSGPPVRKSKFEWDDGCLKYDRHWMLSKLSGQMISQREYPQLNTLKMEEKGDTFILASSDGQFPSIEFSKENEIGNKIQVEVWGQTFESFVTQKELSVWFSDYLSEQVFVVSNPDRIKVYSKEGQENSMKLKFHDGYPVHIANIKSINWLKEVCKKQLHPLQFRANAYLDMDKAFDEDHLSEFSINNTPFRKIKDCSRCIMVNLHPGSEVFYKEPLASLSTWRRKGNHVYFGIYAKPINE
ncbi:MAG: MOSC domain-containing protein [Saprospiraceae bacterium]|nr:MOSC domain-containing protein [Saprospiraceae bacterium]